jgi:hypothetical protein
LQCILEIKILRKKISEQSLPGSVASTIEAHEKTVAESGIDKIVEDLVKEFGKQRPKERLNELRNALRTGLRFLAQQIDAGVDLEVRAEPPRPKDVAEDAGQPVKSEKAKRALETARKTTARIQRAGAAMRTLDRTGDPILALDFGEKGKKSSSSEA